VAKYLKQTSKGLTNCRAYRTNEGRVSFFKVASKFLNGGINSDVISFFFSKKVTIGEEKKP